jgi:hypothetical protein
MEENMNVDYKIEVIEEKQLPEVNPPKKLNITLLPPDMEEILLKQDLPVTFNSMFTLKSHNVIILFELNKMIIFTNKSLTKLSSKPPSQEDHDEKQVYLYLNLVSAFIFGYVDH